MVFRIMAELILEIYEDEGNSYLVPMETAICLTVIENTSSHINVTLVLNRVDDSLYRVRYTNLEFLASKEVKFQQLAFRTVYTALPTVVLEEGLYYVAGLAAVLRQIVRCSNRKELLGFRHCCLAAPAEVSSWTRFCEVDIVYCLQNVISNRGINDQSINFKTNHCLPNEFAILEYHLSLPAKVHQKGKYGEGGPKHDYVEGPHMVVSDLVIALCVHLILDYLRALDTNAIPFIQKWMKRVKNMCNFSNCLLSFENISRVEENAFDNWILPELKGKPVDLYKKEGTRRKRIFTQGDLLSSSLDVISEVPLMQYQELFNIEELNDVGIVLPDVPKDRLERKSQQLTNLAKAALLVAKEGDILVDLCCGSGHLGLLLATLLPTCTIILLDNKEKSSERARLRVLDMNLSNVRVVQSNLDYFSGKFQVGVSLHACGVASDLVIKKCLDSQAHLVLCPCCYGGIQSNHIVHYPQSTVFRSTGLEEHDFFVLAHNADTYDTEQGRLAMTAVDTDRCLFLSQNGYKVQMTKLQPPDCTTRNNLIIAVRH